MTARALLRDAMQQVCTRRQHSMTNPVRARLNHAFISFEKVSLIYGFPQIDGNALGPPRHLLCRRTPCRPMQGAQAASVTKRHT